LPIELGFLNRSFHDAQFPWLPTPEASVTMSHNWLGGWEMAEGDGDEKASASTPTVFVSYASQDVAVANTIVEALERRGVRCWIAPRDVTPGASYAGQIIHAIDAAKASVLILSQDAASSPHVLREVERSASKRHPIVSLRIDQTPLPADFEYFLNASHWLDASPGDIGRALPKLVAAVQAALNAPAAVPAGAPTSHTPAPAVSGRSSNRTAILVASVIGLGLVAFAVDRLWLSSHRAAATPASAVAVSAPIPGPAAPIPGPAAPTIPEKSVAVLPFADTSEKKDQEYFSDGLSEELIDLLGRVPGLRVPARTSSFYFKGKQATLAEIAKALSVTHVLEGSVRKSGRQLRVTAELVRVADDSRIWSETFDRKLDDVFKVQDDIAGAVVKALKISLLARQEVYSTPTANSEAYTMYLKGKSTMRGGTEEDFIGAQSYFERTVAIDPGFAPGWAAVGDLRSDLYGSYRVPRRYQEVAPSAHAEVSRALELDPNLPEAHLALGRIAFMIDLDWDTATRELSRTLELAPGNAIAWRFRSYLAGTLGDAEQQRFFAERAIANDPLDYWNYFAAGLAGYTGGRLVEGEQSLRRAIELNDRAGVLHAFLARLLVTSGKPDQALDELKRETAPAWRALAKPLALDALGRRKEADEALAGAQALYADTYASQIALVYAARNDPENALKWLERSYRQHDSSPIFLRHDPLLRSLEGNPGYKAFLHKMKLPQ
jgi:adenylate cyclase